jgi:hypothetical protein
MVAAWSGIADEDEIKKPALPGFVWVPDGGSPVRECGQWGLGRRDEIGDIMRRCRKISSRNTTAS